MSTKKEKLIKLEAELVTAAEAHSKVIADVRKLRKEIWHEETGINLNDRVLFMDGKVQKTGILVRLEVSSIAKYPIIKVDKKDGTPGQRESRCWDEKTLKKI